MIERSEWDVVVIGAGSGSAMGRRLAVEGRRVLIACRDDATPATVRNHRIKHSGAMQERLDTAAELWWAFRSMDRIERDHLSGQGAVVSVPEPEVDRVTERWRAVGIPFAEVPPYEGGPSASRGDHRRFFTPDRPIDYAAVVRKTLRSAASEGAHMARVRASRLEADGGSLRCVRFETASGDRIVTARWVVLAAGAWTPELLDEIGVDLHLSRWRSHVLEIPGRVVPRLAIRLGPSLLVATPLERSTVVGDGRRVPARGGDPLVDPECAERLRRDAGACLPGVSASALRAATVTVGVKTEPPGHGTLAQGTALFGPERHGIDGLLVALPGKASLMFALADRVAARIGTGGAEPLLPGDPGAMPVGVVRGAGGGDRATW